MRNFRRNPEPGRNGPVVAATDTHQPFHRLQIGGEHAVLSALHPTIDQPPITKDGERSTLLGGPVPMRVGVTRARA
jgi:hypothetical protein